MPRRKLPTHTDAQLQDTANEIWSLLSYLIVEDKKREIYTALINEYVGIYADEHTAVEKNKIKKLVRNLILSCGYTITNSPSKVKNNQFDELSFTSAHDDSYVPYEKRDFIRERLTSMRENYPQIDDATAKELLAKHHEAVKAGKTKLALSYRDQIAGSHYYLIIVALNKYKLLNKKNDLSEDMIDEAILTLWKAIEDYDPSKSKNGKVSSYLTTRLYYFCKTLIVVPLDSLIKVPSYVHTEKYKVDKFISEYEMRFGKVPTDDEIKEQMGLKNEIWSYIQELRHHLTRQAILSFDVVYEDNTKFADVVPDEFDIEDNYDNSEFVAKIHEILRASDIPMRSQMMIRYKFGLIDGKSHSNKETGEWIAQYNKEKTLTAESVRKNIQPALTILADCPELKNYL